MGAHFLPVFVLNVFRTTLLLAVICGTGCFAGVSLKPVQTDVSFRKLQANALSTDGFSFHTAHLLRTYDLQESYRKDVQGALQTLRDEACGTDDRTFLFGLAELACYAGKQAEKKRPDDALAFYCSSVRYAYFFLFDDEFGAPPDPFDPRFRLACSLYNFSLARGIRLMQQIGHSLSEDSYDVPLWDGSLHVTVERQGFLPEEDIDRVMLASEYDVKGIRNQYRTFGLGVPLIAVGTEPPKESFLPKNPSFAATAFLQIDGSACGSPHSSATLELLDSMQIQSVAVDENEVPLESDITTPLGFFLSDPELERTAYIGLLRAERVVDESGLYMLDPYQPDKIPVVLIHGLVSSPLTWADMLNDLRGQPELRDRYQFWFFQYPTGYPFAYPASQLRSALLDVRETFDPEHDDAAFDEMVLVGHSMGGLIAKMMVQDGSDTLWNSISRKPLSELNTTPEEEQLIRDVFFFETLPFVKCVIFISTPHQGSSLSEGPLGTLLSIAIAIPKAMLTEMVSFVNRNPGALKGEVKKRRLTSVDNLSPGNPIIVALQEIPMAPGVAYHTIAGQKSDDVESDGIVAHSSSHLEGAASEKIVPAGHSAHYHPLAILEVRRILQEHLKNSP
jgi:pimeloyl-ACP methyl ester carboxylesterase